MAPTLPTRKLIIRAASMLRAGGPLAFRTAMLELGVSSALVGGKTVEDQAIGLAEYVLDNRDHYTEEGVALADALIDLAQSALEANGTFYVDVPEREAFEAAYQENQLLAQQAIDSLSRRGAVASDTPFTPMAVASTFDGSRGVADGGLGPIGTGQISLEAGGRLSANLEVGRPLDPVFDLYRPYGVWDFRAAASDVRDQLDIALREADRIGFEPPKRGDNQGPPEILFDGDVRSKAQEAIDQIENLDTSAPDALDRARAAGRILVKVATQLATWTLGKLDAMATGFAEQLGKSAAEYAVKGIAFYIGLQLLSGAILRVVDMVSWALPAG